MALQLSQYSPFSTRVPHDSKSWTSSSLQKRTPQIATPHLWSPVWQSFIITLISLVKVKSYHLRRSLSARDIQQTRNCPESLAHVPIDNRDCSRIRRQGQQLDHAARHLATVSGSSAGWGSVGWTRGCSGRCGIGVLLDSLKKIYSFFILVRCGCKIGGYQCRSPFPRWHETWSLLSLPFVGWKCSSRCLALRGKSLSPEIPVKVQEL